MTDARPRDAKRTPPFAILALALGLVVLVPVLALVIVHGFDGLYGQDAFGYTDYSLGPLTEALRNLQPPPPFFWTPGYPLLVALTALATGVGSSAGQVVSLVAGASAPVFAALLASELVPADETRRARTVTALLAGLALALTGQLMQSSAVAMSDTAALAASTIAAWAVCRYARTGQAVMLCVGAGFATYAVDVRLVYGLVALVLAFVGLVGLTRTYRVDRMRASAHFIAAMLVTIVVVAPIGAPIVAAVASGQPVPFVGQLDVHRWSATNIMSSSIDTIDGHLDYGLPMIAFYLLQPFQHYWFLAIGLLALPGMIAVMRRREAISAAVLLVWPLLELGYLVGDAYQNTRYLHVAAVPIAILIAFGALAVYRFIEHRFGARHPRSTLVFVAVVGILSCSTRRWPCASPMHSSNGSRAMPPMSARWPLESPIAPASSPSAPRRSSITMATTTSSSSSTSMTSLSWS